MYKMLPLVVGLLLTVPVHADSDKEPAWPIPKDNWDLKGLDDVSKEARLKSISYDAGKKEVRVLMQFVEDADLSFVFAPRNQEYVFLFHFIDKDGVTLQKLPHKGYVGDLKGRKGDGFRLIVPLPDEETIKATAKVEARVVVK